MDQERNPNKNAELSMEQNGNMIDGIITVSYTHLSGWSAWLNYFDSSLPFQLSFVNRRSRSGKCIAELGFVIFGCEIIRILGRVHLYSSTYGSTVGICSCLLYTSTPNGL